MQQTSVISDPVEPLSAQITEQSDEDEDPPDNQPPALADHASLPAPAQTLPFSIQLSASTARPQQRALFRHTFFPGVTARQWNNWRWQVANRIRGKEQLARFLDLSREELQAFDTSSAGLPLAITPYYMSLLAPRDPRQPLRRAVVPTTRELLRSPGEADDPLNEEHQSPVPGLIHRYPDRVLFLVHDFCSTYCRYCTRSRVVGRNAVLPDQTRWERILAYIRATRSIRDVLLSGGDPLLLTDERLAWLLGELRRIPHVEIIRIGSKVPAVLPQRITPALVRMLRRFHPLWMSLHFMHPDECTPETEKACARLADAGIPLGSQTVLLRGINDSVTTMKELMHHLMRMRVRPYYLYQCDPISGSAHFRTTVAKGLEIMRGLRGFTTGYAVPTYVIDAPGGGGKIPIMPETVVAHHDGLLLRNYEGKCFRYPDLL